MDPHRETGWLGSASMMVTVVPRVASSVANRTAELDLPHPPLELANEMVGTLHFPVQDGHCRLLRRQIVNCLPSDISRMADRLPLAG
jgi:hypothetical protein